MEGRKKIIKMESPSENDSVRQEDELVVKFKSELNELMPILFRVAYSMTRNYHDAEDLVQETILLAFRAFDKFDGRYFKAWIFTIMKNANMKRGRKKRPELLRDGDLSQVAQEFSSKSTETAAEDSLFVQAVRSAMNTLPHAMKVVIQFVDMDGLTYDETAAALNIPVGTVMSRLHRGRNRIKNNLINKGIGTKG